MRRRHFVGAVVAAVLVPAAAALSDWAPISRSDLVRATPEVLRVRVDGIDTEMRSLPAVRHAVPCRRVRATVLETYRGDREAGEPIVFFVPGGAAPGGTEVTFSTSPAIEEFASREALVFLAAGGPLAPEGELGLPDGAHGIYAVDATRSGARVVRARTGSPFPRDLPLAEFAAEARAIAASEATGVERKPR